MILAKVNSMQLLFWYQLVAAFDRVALGIFLAGLVYLPFSVILGLELLARVLGPVSELAGAFMAVWSLAGFYSVLRLGKNEPSF